ncbi:MAG: hypothetical protein M0Z91_01420 [Actinomycetota bacterium]|nr:hypothetical protein [Actinomycetota bacterium]
MSPNQDIYPVFRLRADRGEAEFCDLCLFRADVESGASRMFAGQAQWLMPTFAGILGSREAEVVLRGGEVELSELAALRLGLLFELVEGVYSWKALINLGAAVSALSVEECYYFYAKVNGTQRRGAVRKGLRLMLAG